MTSVCSRAYSVSGKVRLVRWYPKLIGKKKRLYPECEDGVVPEDSQKLIPFDNGFLSVTTTGRLQASLIQPQFHLLIHLI